MKLKLERPIIFFDLETTGLTIGKDHIVELCFIRQDPNGCERAETLRFNPGMHIPKASSDVHGITDEDVKDCPTFAEKAEELARVFEGCDLAGYNSNRFDVPMLAEEFAFAGIDIHIEEKRLIELICDALTKDGDHTMKYEGFHDFISFHVWGTLPRDGERIIEKLDAVINEYENKQDIKAIIGPDSTFTIRSAY